MYRTAYKHIELFKQIPFTEFVSNSSFLNKVVNQPEEYATYENIIKCYYFIAEELWDPANIKPAIQYYADKSCFYFYDFVRKRQEFTKIKRYKPIKLFKGVLDNNGALDKDGKNRHFKKTHGLVVKNKHNVSKDEVQKLHDFFIKFALMYDQDLKFYKRNEFELPTEWAEHLYEILNQLSEKADFFYKQRSSFMLAQEMVSLLSNQSLFVHYNNLIKYGKLNKNKAFRQIREKKQFMFGEIKHDIEHYKKIKNQNQR